MISLMGDNKKLGLLRKNKGVKIDRGVVRRESQTKDGGTIVVKAKINPETEDLQLSRRLARLMFNF